MKLRVAAICLGVASAAALVTPAQAGPALDDDRTETPTEDAAAAAAAKFNEVQWGIGVRLRNVRAPQALLDLFLEHTPGGSSNFGIGLDFVRRRGNVELQLGFEYERIEPAEGVWIESGANVAGGDEADYIVSPDRFNGDHLGWFTAEFTFIHHTPVHKNIALRYGGGAGIGIVTGKLGRYNVLCNGATNANPEPGCVPPDSPYNGSGTVTGSGGVETYNLPPVFPVINAILGVQFRPSDQITINLEGGIRTFPFFGISGGYFF